MDNHPPCANRPPVRTDKLLPGPGVLLSRSLVYIVLVMITAAAVWAWSTQVDEVVVAPGRITIEGEPMAITVPETGLVREVAVQVGDPVQQGDVLLRLDPFAHQAELRRARAEVKTLEVQVARYLAGAESATAVLAALGAEAKAVQHECQLLADQLRRLEKLRKNSRVNNVVSLDQLQEKAQQHERSRARLFGLEADRHRAERDAAEKRQLAEETRARIAELQTTMEELAEKIRRTTMVAPADGTVTELALVHPGSVLDASRPAVVLVPGDQALAAKIQLANRCMRRLRVGLGARIRLDAFPQEDYGYLEGRVVSIEPDAKENGDYIAWIRIERSEHHRSGLIGQLKPGLNLEAKIIVDRRSVLDFLLKPLRRLAEPVSIAS